MAEFVEVMRQRNRMCKTYTHCLCGCLLAEMLEESGTANCNEYAKAYPTEFESAVMTWAKNNPEKTMRDVLFEKFPNAQKKPDGSPYICVTHVGFKKPESCVMACSRCWKRPAPEEYQHE